MPSYHITSVEIRPATSSESEHIVLFGCEDRKLKFTRPEGGRQLEANLADFYTTSGSTLLSEGTKTPLQVETSSKGVKYVRSAPDKTVTDNLLHLPRTVPLHYELVGSRYEA